MYIIGHYMQICICEVNTGYYMCQVNTDEGKNPHA